MSFINDLRPITYNWKKQKDISKDFNLYKKNVELEVDDEAPCLGHNVHSYGTTYHGFIAQEVKAVIDNHSEIKEGFSMWQEYGGIQTIADGSLVPMLVTAVKELSTKIDAMQIEINNLK